MPHFVLLSLSLLWRGALSADDACGLVQSSASFAQLENATFISRRTSIAASEASSSIPARAQVNVRGHRRGSIWRGQRGNSRWRYPRGRRSTEIGNPTHSNVSYAIFTCGIPKYRAKLESTMETWGARVLAEERFFAVGPKDYPAEWHGKGIVLSSCPDGPSSLACKEASIINEAVRRGTDWVVISGEDNYIDTVAFDALLAQHRSDEPKAIGFHGCGVGWCPELEPQGGFCGGDGYALNRAALLKMVQPSMDQMMKEYTEEYKGYPNDMATSCLLKKRGVPLEHGFGGRSYGSETIAKKHFEQILKSGFLSMHYITTDVMRWIHAKVNHDELQAVEFYAKAFDDRGCCYGCTTAVNEEGKQRQMQECWKVMAEDGVSTLNEI